MSSKPNTNNNDINEFVSQYNSLNKMINENKKQMNNELDDLHKVNVAFPTLMNSTNISQISVLNDISNRCTKISNDSKHVKLLIIDAKHINKKLHNLQSKDKEQQLCLRTINVLEKILNLLKTTPVNKNDLANQFLIADRATRQLCQIGFTGVYNAFGAYCLGVCQDSNGNNVLYNTNNLEDSHTKDLVQAISDTIGALKNDMSIFD